MNAKERQRQYSRDHYARNRATILDARKQAYAADAEFRDRINSYAKARATQKPDEVRAKIKQWRDANPDRTASYSGTRRAKKREDYAKLSREEKDRVRDFYALAYKLTQTTGVIYEVDHIRPLFLGGAHHPDNLVVMTKGLNRSKGKHHWPWLRWFLET